SRASNPSQGRSARAASFLFLLHITPSTFSIATLTGELTDGCLPSVRQTWGQFSTGFARMSRVNSRSRYFGYESVILEIASGSHIVDLDFGRLTASVWDGEKQLAELWHEQTRPSARRRLKLLYLRVMIGVLLGENGDEAFSADDVEALLRGVVEQ